jgi:hypothetical protein
MIYELEKAYKENTPSDEQGDCIEIFFCPSEFWEQFGIDELDGSDEESNRMINLFLGSLGPDVPPHIRKMLIDWRDHGF